MGTKNMGSQLSGWLADNYPLSKSDLMTAFMERAQTLAHQHGFWGMINLPSWMFLTSFEDLRRALLRTVRFQSLLHLGRGVFGSDFGSVAFVACNAPHTPGHHGIYRRLFEKQVEVRSVEKIRMLFLDKNYGEFRADQATFAKVPGSPFAYWLPESILNLAGDLPSVTEVLTPRSGLFTTDNALFLRYFWEVSWARTCVDARSDEEALASQARWFAHNKGGVNRKWFGNYEYVVDWENLGERIKVVAAAKYPYLNGNVGMVVHDDGYYFRPSISWSEIRTSTAPAFRAFDAGFTFNYKGMSAFTLDPSQPLPLATLALLNSPFVRALTPALNPSMSFGVGNFRSLPFIRLDVPIVEDGVRELVQIARSDWDSFETSWRYERNPLVASGQTSLHSAFEAFAALWCEKVAKAHQIEEAVNGEILIALKLEEELSPRVEIDEITLLRNPHNRYRSDLDATEARRKVLNDAMGELISYAVGCMFGRYSLDKPGLILADQEATIEDYLAEVPTPTFVPDADNVIPIVDGDWFDDDIVARFRRFLRTAFGEQHFEENLRFVIESLGVKDLRDYFVKSFYKDHVQRYKKRPIYWLFSSPRGSFNALIYMHRYTPSTVSTVLNEYLREYKAKLGSSLQHHERLAAGGGTPREQAAAQKESDRLRKVLLELDEYEHDVLYPLASHQIQIDLDDGVKVNYPKFGAALKKIPGLEVAE